MAATHSQPRVQTVPTPNPDAKMFRVQEALVPTGTFEFKDLAGTGDAPLAAQLLGLRGIELILIAPRFVTVRKQPAEDWSSLEPAVTAQINAFLDSGEMAVLDQVIRKDPRVRTAIEERILAVLEEEIRPAIAQDGGDVVYLGFEDGIVRLKLIGACGTCPSSVTTLKMGIERLLMEEIPEVRGVEPAE